MIEITYNKFLIYYYNYRYIYFSSFPKFEETFVVFSFYFFIKKPDRCNIHTIKKRMKPIIAQAERDKI